MSEELKPCPFCGGEAERVNNSDAIENVYAGSSYIRCMSCDAATRLHYGEKTDLLSSWNERADHSPDAGKVQPEPAADLVERVRQTLFSAFASAEPDHPVSKFPTSYIATFDDMARAVIALFQPQMEAAERMLSEIEECEDFFRREGMTDIAESLVERIVDAKEAGFNVIERYTCQHCNNGWHGDAGYSRDFECKNGVAVDIDEWFEGLSLDVVRPLAPCHPGFCKACRGTGNGDGGDCEACNGTGNTLGPNDSLERLQKTVRSEVFHHHLTDGHAFTITDAAGQDIQVGAGWAVMKEGELHRLLGLQKQMEAVPRLVAALLGTKMGQVAVANLSAINARPEAVVKAEAWREAIGWITGLPRYGNEIPYSATVLRLLGNAADRLDPPKGAV